MKHEGNNCHTTRLTRGDLSSGCCIPAILDGNVGTLFVGTCRERKEVVHVIARVTDMHQ